VVRTVDYNERSVGRDVISSEDSRAKFAGTDVKTFLNVGLEIPIPFVLHFLR
jgi:hypothetical protein